MQKAAITLWGMLLTAGFLWPSQAAHTGEGLQFAVLWLLAAAGIAWSMNGRLTGSRIITLSTAAVTLLSAGFLLSTLGVFQFGGERRTAVNLTLHFASAVAGWIIVQRLCAAGRQMLVVQLLAGLGVGVAVLGIVDYHYLLPKERDWYENATEQERMNAGIPMSGPARISMENRLLHSTEPQGPFALTNTLGGVLAVIVVLLSGMLLIPQNAEFRRRSVIVFVLTCGYCLLLTKSRTAWVAAAAGVCIQAILLRTKSGQSSRRLLLWAAAAAGLAGAVFMAALGAGLLDLEVVLEAPRSLQFRLFYWIGSTDVILDSPILGTGPGNFRSAYLMYKVAESSEAVFDPHNIVFDAWISAGLLGFAGILLVGGTTVASVLERDGSSTESPETLPVHQERGLRLMLFGGGLAFIVWEFLLGNPLTGFQLPTVGWVGEFNGAWMIPLVALPVTQVIGTARIPRITPGLCLLALLIHLLGAGGLHILIVLQLLLTLHALSFRWLTNGPDRAGRPIAVGAMAGALLVLWLGIRPNLDRVGHMITAEGYLRSGKPKKAVKSFENACESDPWSLNSAQRSAGLLTYMFEDRYQDLGARKSVPAVLERDYNEAMRAADRFVEMDPRGYTGFLFRSRIQQVYAKLTEDSRVMSSATSDLKSAVERYPTNAHLIAELAEHLSAAGQRDEASQAAQKALQQNKLNHNWKHTDRYLPEPLVERLTGLAGPAQE